MGPGARWVRSQTSPITTVTGWLVGSAIDWHTPRSGLTQSPNKAMDVVACKPFDNESASRHKSIFCSLVLSFRDCLG